MVIDELIVVLGLDSRKFTEGQRDAVQAFKKGKEGAVDFGKSVEESSQRMGDALGMARKGVLGVIGALAGGEAAAFLGHVIGMDAAAGRMAKTIGINVANLSTWQYMIRQVGGEASSATSALSTLQQEIENVRQGGGMFEGGFASLMNQAGVSIKDDADTSLRKIQQFIAGQIGSGKMRPEEASTFLRRVPGMNQDLLNLMLADFARIEAAAKAAGTATKETSDASAALVTKFSLLTQALERFGASMVPVIDMLMKPVRELGKKDLQGIGGNDLFDRDSPLDRLDRWIWGDHNMEAARDKLRRGMGGGGGAGGSTRGDRNNNPGNMEYGAFARAHGATGQDGRFAVFPDWATGSAAQAALVGGSGYAGMTLHDFARKYAEGSPAWEGTVGRALGIGPNDVVDNRDPRLLGAIRRAEGTGAAGAAAARAAGARSSSTSTSSSEQHNTFHIQQTDPDKAAQEIGSVLERQSMISPFNSSLV